MKVLITGLNGFVGRHLTRELLANGHVVSGVGLGALHAELEGLVDDYVDADRSDAWPAVHADAVVHLAARSRVGPSFDAPQQYIEDNSAPVTHLCEALVRRDTGARVVVVSSGAVYSAAGDAQVYSESSRVAPTSPYAISKILVETQCAYYRRQGLDIVVMRPFNHIGPGQGPGFILPDLAAGVGDWLRTGRPLKVGDLRTRRDYTDVRDVVRAYRLALESPAIEHPVLNVCSGRSVSGETILDMVLEAFGVQPAVEIDTSRLRRDDPSDICGDNSLARAALAWVPSVPLEQSVTDVVGGTS